MASFVRNFDALDATEPYDVCIAGAGLAGTVLGVKLVRAGLRVLLVDAGASPSSNDRPALDAAGGARHGVLPFVPGSGGGSHFLWHDICERLDPGDFRVHPYNRRSNPWPIGYADLEPYYRAAEQMLRVRQVPPAPGRHLPQCERGRSDPALAALLRRHGIDAKGAARATPGRGRKTFTTSAELLPEFLVSRKGTLVSGVTVTRLRTDGNGRVIGAVCRTADGVSKTARAETFVVAAGAVETPRLLLLSRSQRFTRGLGNDLDRVGRGLTDQAIVRAQGRIERLGGRPRVPPPVHTEQFHQMFRRDGLGAVHPFFVRAVGVIGPDGWRARLADAVHRREAVTLACRVETVPADDNRVTLSTSLDVFGDPRAQLVFDYSAEDLELIARTRAWLERWLERLGSTERSQGDIEWAGCPSGTCRIGADPRTSVCDPMLRVHSSPNLYVCGAATFPRGGAVPPALTVAALAHRLAEHIAARVRWCARATPKPPHTPAAATVAAPIPLVRRRPQP
ncbi:MAG TPA: GMC family oxidoreductase [Gammaproteobacteria bacterium]